MTPEERSIINAAVKYPNNYKFIENLARLAETAIKQRNNLLAEKAKKVQPGTPA